MGRDGRSWSAGLVAAAVLGCGSTMGDTGTGAGATGSTTAGETDPDPSAGSDDAPADGTGTSGGVSTTGSGPDSTGMAEDTGPPPAQCEVASLFDPGVHSDITVDVDGVSRSYDLFVPTTYDPSANAPLVLNFHGLLSNPGQQAAFSQFNPSAEDYGMLVAYPAGIGNSFNGGVCCAPASSQGVDDVGFARALVEDVASKMCVDPRRVYATGMSNGGHMAHRLACEAADVFAATASVTGVLSLAGPCVPSRPISMIQFHGTADTIVQYEGFPPVEPMMEAWAVRNGCSSSTETIFDQGDIFGRTWPGCDAGVEVSLYTVEGGGHCWPGNAVCPFGNSSTELHASDVIAAMFDEQFLP